LIAALKANLWPLIWLGAGVAFAAAGLGEVSRPSLDFSLHNTYYVVGHAHYTMSLAAAFVCFGLLYLALDRAVRLPYRKLLAWAQLWITLFGALLIVAPGIWLHLTETSPMAQAAREFAWLNTISSAGYWMSLLGLAAFFGVIIDGTMRLVRTRPLRPGFSPASPSASRRPDAASRTSRKAARRRAASLTRRPAGAVWLPRVWRELSPSLKAGRGFLAGGAFRLAACRQLS